MKLKKNLSILTVILIAGSTGLLIDCKSSSPMEDQVQEQAKQNPMFGADIQPIFSGNCALGGCHDNTASGGLNLTAGNAYANLINVVSTEDNTKNRVTPNNAQDSYLVIKIEGRQTTGGRMPLGRSPLSSASIQNIRNWINNGANNN